MLNQKICIIGLGYVGLPLAVAFAKKYNVVGFDIDVNRIKDLNNSIDKTLEVESFELEAVKNNIVYSLALDDIKECDIYIITVPTPIDKSNKPDLTPLLKFFFAFIMFLFTSLLKGLTITGCGPGFVDDMW